MKKIVCIVLIILLANLVGCSKNNSANSDKIDYKQAYEKLLQEQLPLIKDIKFESTDGKVLTPDAGWYIIGNKVKIVISLKGDCQEVDLFTTPSGSAVYKAQKLIEIIYPENNIAEYTWDVPPDTMGFLHVIAYNKNVGRRSELINISSKK